MKVAQRVAGAVVLSAAMAAVAWAQAPALNVRMGLWEVTSTVNLGGEMPMMDTSKMTPQQKAQVEQAMKSMMGAHTNTDRSCMTKEKFNAASFMGQNGANCKQAFTTNTASALDATVTCTGDHPMTASMHIDALSQTSIKATMKSADTEQGKTMTMNGTMTGKWLSADCGDVK